MRACSRPAVAPAPPSPGGRPETAGRRSAAGAYRWTRAPAAGSRGASPRAAHAWRPAPCVPARWTCAGPAPAGRHSRRWPRSRWAPWPRRPGSVPAIARLRGATPRHARRRRSSRPATGPRAPGHARRPGLHMAAARIQPAQPIARRAQQARQFVGLQQARGHATFAPGLATALDRAQAAAGERGLDQPLLPAAQSMPNSSISLNTTPGASLPKRTSRRPASPG